jgi:hypothetical protein
MQVGDAQPFCPAAGGLGLTMIFTAVDTDAPLYTVEGGGAEDAESCDAPIAIGDGARIVCRSVKTIDPVTYDIISTFDFDGADGGTIENSGIRRGDPERFPCMSSFTITSITAL